MNMELTINRDKWLRGAASPLMRPDGCGCVLGHYMAAVGVPALEISGHYGFGEFLEPFAERIARLGEFEPDEGAVYFRKTQICDQIMGVNDGDPRSLHDFHVYPVNNDEQREQVLIRLMKEIDCDLKFV